MGKEHPISDLRSGSVGRSHFFGPVNYMIFEAIGGYPIHVCGSSSISGKSLQSMLDTLVFADCGNMDSMMRKEPPKTVTFYENLGRSCNIDGPE